MAKHFSEQERIWNAPTLTHYPYPYTHHHRTQNLAPITEHVFHHVPFAPHSFDEAFDAAKTELDNLQQSISQDIAAQKPDSTCKTVPDQEITEKPTPKKRSVIVNNAKEVTSARTSPDQTQKIVDNPIGDKTGATQRTIKMPNVPKSDNQDKTPILHPGVLMSEKEQPGQAGMIQQQRNVSRTQNIRIRSPVGSYQGPCGFNNNTHAQTKTAPFYNVINANDLRNLAFEIRALNGICDLKVLAAMLREIRIRLSGVTDKMEQIMVIQEIVNKYNSTDEPI